MAKKKVHTQEELLKIKLENAYNNIKDEIKFIPEPTIQYKIGQQVCIGSLKDCVIEDILEDGKIYLIDYTHFNNNYGNPIETPNEKMYVKWFNISTGVIGDSQFTKLDDIKINYSQMSINSLFTKVYSFGVNFEPEYQRDYVWELKDKESLIESIFNNVEIGKFSFIHYDDNKWQETGFSYEILDGKQRLSTLCEFYEGRIKYKGLTYRELSPKDRNHISNYPVSVGEARNATEKEIIEYFIKLNSHGKIMSEEHLNKVKEMI